MDLPVPLRCHHHLHEVGDLHLVTLFELFHSLQVPTGQWSLSFGDLRHADLSEIELFPSSVPLGFRPSLLLPFFC